MSIPTHPLLRSSPMTSHGDVKCVACRQRREKTGTSHNDSRSYVCATGSGGVRVSPGASEKCLCVHFVAPVHTKRMHATDSTLAGSVHDLLQEHWGQFKEVCTFGNHPHRPELRGGKKAKLALSPLCAGLQSGDHSCREAALAHMTGVLRRCEHTHTHTHTLTHTHKHTHTHTPHSRCLTTHTWSHTHTHNTHMVTHTHFLLPYSATTRRRPSSTVPMPAPSPNPVSHLPPTSLGLEGGTGFAAGLDRQLTAIGAEPGWHCCWSYTRVLQAVCLEGEGMPVCPGVCVLWV
jgi:hypothetical protein